MIDPKKEISIFKSYLKSNAVYKGGKSKHDIAGFGKKVYKLSSNENLLGSSPKAIAALQQHIHHLNEYPDRTGMRLQQALDQFYNKQLSTDHFIATPSGSEVLDLIIRGFLGEGLECIISNPCFVPYIMFSEKQGAKVIDIPLQAPDFSLNVDAILAAINDKTRLIFLTNPNNPTGTHIPKDKLEKLIHNVPDHVIIVLDEVYYQFADAADYTTALPYVKAGKKIIGLNSFSKAYGLAGLRIGYAYSTPEIANYIRQLCKPFLVNALSMEAAIAALEDKEFIQQTVDLIQTEKEYLYRELDKNGIQYWKTQANFILTKPKVSPQVFEEQLQKEGIMIRPTTNFGAPNCARVTIGTHEANEAFINALNKIT